MTVFECYREGTAAVALKEMYKQLEAVKLSRMSMSMLEERRNEHQRTKGVKFRC